MTRHAAIWILRIAACTGLVFANLSDGSAQEQPGLYHPVAGPQTTLMEWTRAGGQAYGQFGYAVCSAGDVNGDGYADVAFGANGWDSGEQDEGCVFVHYGGVLGLHAEPDWRAEGGQAYALFGSAAAPAGDVNGDGFSDFLIGAPAHDTAETGAGCCYLFLGSSTGLSNEPPWRAKGQQAHARLGTCVASAGDVNGDGYDDVITCAPYHDDAYADEGRVFVYHGSGSGLPSEPSTVLDGEQAGACFGFSAAGAGDVNGDGFGDVIVGAPGYDGSLADTGQVFLFYGSKEGLDETAGWVGRADFAGSRFGASVSPAGDVNGDGYSDIIVGAHLYSAKEEMEGAAFVYYGSATGPAGAPGWRVEGGQGRAELGRSVAAAGDLNADGFDDIVVGALDYDNDHVDEGRVFIYYGSSSGLGNAPDWMAESDRVEAYFGSPVAAAGDVNNDGFGDVLVGAYLYDDARENEGRVFVYYGGRTGVGMPLYASLQCATAGAALGHSVSGAGDVNGDGFADIAAGAVGYTSEHAAQGACFVYHGSPEGIDTQPAWSAEGRHAQAWFGYSVSKAGDVNGDGFGDVIIGAPCDKLSNETGYACLYSGSESGLAAESAWTCEGTQPGGRFGFCVASAGDVNRDGYDDVIVSTPFEMVSENQRGRVSVYYGSPSGLAPAASWTVRGMSHQSDFGFAACGAGDVNGDGFADVAVGVPGFTSSENTTGAVLVYFGSADGLSPSAGWLIEGFQSGLELGRSLSPAGDINGDGFSDIIVGTPRFVRDRRNAGCALAYHGSSGTPADMPAWLVYGPQEDAGFGTWVACAGDLDNDGFSDVVVTAPRHRYSSSHDHDKPHAGRVYVFRGSPGGLRKMPGWSGEGNLSSGGFGSSACGTGDVNGDGISGLAVGAPAHGEYDTNQGVVYVFYFREPEEKPPETGRALQASPAVSHIPAKMP